MFTNGPMGGREENAGILCVLGSLGPNSTPGSGLVPAGGRLATVPLELCSHR